MTPVTLETREKALSKEKNIVFTNPLGSKK